MHIQTSEQSPLNLGFGNYTCNWGTHFCGLYESETERDEIIMGYLSEGAKAGDLQLYCPVERSADEFRDTFATCCPSCAAHLNSPDRFQLLSARNLYYPNGSFSPWAMDDGLNSFFEESQRNGKQHIRATAEMAWALEAIPGVEHLMAYESRLNYFIAGKPWISICLYNVNKFDGKTILQVLQTHPFIISQGIVTENPFFINPDTWLAKYAPQFMQREHSQQ